MSTGMLIRSHVALLLALVALTGTGCVTLDAQGMHSAAPIGSPRILTVLWDPRVFLNPDTVHNGKPVPTLAGTLHMMGENDRFVTARGTIVVDLYDVTNNQEPHQLERWVFDPESLKKLQVCDGWGWGYRLILPWGTYRPDIAKVELRTQFDRENMPALYSGSSPLTLVQPDHPLTMPGTEPQKPSQLLIGPMNHQAPAATGVQQTSYTTTPAPNAVPSSGIQTAGLWTPNAAPATTPAAPQMSMEQMQAIVRQYQTQMQQMQQQQGR